MFEHISALLSAATQYSVLLIERAVVGLFRLCSIIVKKVKPSLWSIEIRLILALQPSMRDQVFVALDLIGRLPPTTSFSVAEQIMTGLLQIIQDRELIRYGISQFKIYYANASWV